MGMQKWRDQEPQKGIAMSYVDSDMQREGVWVCLSRTHARMSARVLPFIRTLTSPLTKSLFGIKSLDLSWRSMFCAATSIHLRREDSESCSTPFTSKMLQRLIGDLFEMVFTRRECD